MKCTILHEAHGRIRVHLCIKTMSLRQADLLEYYMKNVVGVTDVKVMDRTCDAVIFHDEAKAEIVKALSLFSFEKAETLGLVPEHTSRALDREFEDKLVFTVAKRFASKLFLPMPIRSVIAAFRSIKYLSKGFSSLLKGKLSVSVLDATAVGVSIFRGDFGTAGSVMFMLGLGELLEDWTRKKSVSDLAGAMSLNADKVWLKIDGTEILTPVTDIKEGDEIVVRTGNVIPLDGKVVGGEASVNQASMTGESLPVRKATGSYAYAGTVVEDGECIISVEKVSGGGRYDRIVKMIEESEKMKSTAEDKATRLADRLVPYTLGGTALTWLFTRNITKTLSVLMVDFSCALKLSIPIAVISAMKESSRYGISVKGGRFLEAVANADTVVFDKTGTLTKAVPTVAEIVTFGNRREDDMLRLAACLEEHYPHSIANAVVNEAADRGLTHEECHYSVEYIVAHGIIGIVDGHRIAIGSHHFIFEDEGATISDEEKFNSISGEYSQLYMSCDGQLVAVILIEDPVRKEAVKVIETLRKRGFSNIVMMTGDSDKTAKAVSKKVGVDRYFSEVLPEDKAEYVKQLKEEGHTVIMIGDGINDAPALSQADAGIAVSTGAAIAREIADITVSTEDLWALETIKELADAAMKRIKKNYRFIISFNSALIALGVIGIITPQVSALLHNVSTLAVGLKSMTALLPPEEEKTNK